MKVFIAFDGLCEPFDIPGGQTVKKVKQMLKDYFHIQLSDDKQGRRFLELMFAGGVLRDEWVLRDAGITLCSTIKCIVKEEEKPVLYVFNTVTKERVPVMGNIHLFSETVSKLKSLLSVKCGFPVSVFCLRTLEGKEMYDCNTLNDYNLDLGVTLRMDVWNGWKEFLSACVLGHKQNVQRYLSKYETILRFQQRVALYIAAHFGHLELAEWLQTKGVRADVAVGVHPSREWCRDTDHLDIGKCPVHAAAENGQLLLIKSFIARNVLCLDCQNALGQTALKISIHHGHKDCLLYLIMKIWSVVSFPKVSLPMNIYIKVKKWVYTTQKRVHRLKKWAPQFKTRVGDPVVVDGFTESKMTSKDLHGYYQDKWRKVVQTSRAHSSQAIVNAIIKLRPKTLRERTTFSTFPSLKQTGKNPIQRRCQPAWESPNIDDIITDSWTPHISLPPITEICNSRPRNLRSPHAAFLLNSSLESFSKYSGQTPRQSAVYFLSLASEFKEKPWLRQLDMAKRLARKSVHNL
ncbi:protein ANKUB1 [Anomaloglossus baeobatrachus]|uniref:protein ANKUB1 n=1 Tax=Anomaloglossus baeobatrachus TaxID=238106 RepID=UPI003F50A5BC